MTYQLSELGDIEIVYCDYCNIDIAVIAAILYQNIVLQYTEHSIIKTCVPLEITVASGINFLCVNLWISVLVFGINVSTLY